MITSSVIVAVIYLSVLSSVSSESPSSGTVRLYRNGVGDTNQSWSSGIVQIYYNNEWGNICDDSSFGSDEADVICHQLGYTGASSYNNTGDKTEWGIDNSTLTHQVSCSESNYLAVTQCSINVLSSCVGDMMDVTVRCNSTRIWQSPSPGDIRLTGGKYSNEGELEVYCQDKWGTVCAEQFENTEAQISCKQLGYNAYKFKNVSKTGDKRDVFLGFLSSDICSASRSNCLIDCAGGSCGLSDIRACTNSKIIYLECFYDPDQSKVNTRTSNTCQISAIQIALIIGVTIGSIVACLACVCLVVGLPLCICALLGVGIGAALSGSSKSKNISIRKPSAPKDTPLVEQPPAETTTASDSGNEKEPPPPSEDKSDDGDAGEKDDGGDTAGGDDQNKEPSADK